MNRIKKIFKIHKPMDIYAIDRTNLTIEECMKKDRNQLNMKLDKFYVNAHKKPLTERDMIMFDTQLQRIEDLLSFVQADVSLINSKKFDPKDQTNIASFKQELLTEIYMAFVFVAITKNLGKDMNLKTLYDYAVYVYTSY